MADIEGNLFDEPLSSFQWPQALLTTEPTDAPLVHVCFNEDWLPLVLGCLEQLLQDQAWATDDPDALTQVLQRVGNLIFQFQGECPLIPPGTIVQYGGATAPDEWLLCDGSAVSRTTYDALFTAIGTTFGAGNGTTTFNLPDMRSRVPIGSGTGSGLSAYSIGDVGGEETHTLITSETPSHSHTDTGHAHTEGSAAPSLGAAITGVPVPSAVPTPSVTGFASASLTSTGGDGSHNNLQPYLSTNYLIKT
jgi:microcystin-dependent protein